MNDDGESMVTQSVEKIDSRKGVAFALISAVLFGASPPLAKLLLVEIDPLLLAGLLYLGSGLGLIVWRIIKPSKASTEEAHLTRRDVPWLAGAVFFGGVVGPVLLMLGISITPTSTASLLLNLEGVLTALLAWFVFKENFDRRIALGMLSISAGSVIISWAGRPEFGLPWGPIAITAACLCWAIDNNLTRKVSGGDPLQIAAAKGLLAGTVNSLIAFVAGSVLPGALPALYAGIVGFLCYGVSLTLFILALRHLGTARTGAYFSTAPFVGAMISIVLFKEVISVAFMAATLLMAIGLWLHLTERHDHEHNHEELLHEHRHVHDAHHQHEHSPEDPPGEPHTHVHRHVPMRHSHPHYPDIHHRHSH